MANWLLYGTSGCHLCEEAAELLQHASINFEERDIIDDPEAMQRYSLRIPVLRNQASGVELDWPFDEDRLARFIAEN